MTKIYSAGRWIDLSTLSLKTLKSMVYGRGENVETAILLIAKLNQEIVTIKLEIIKREQPK